MAQEVGSTPMLPPGWPFKTASVELRNPAGESSMDQVSMHPQTKERFIDRLAAAPESGSHALVPLSASTGHLEKLQECYRAIARGDFSVLTTHADDDVEMELTGPPVLPMSGKWKGRQQVDAAARANFGAVEDQRAELLASAIAGDDVIVFAREQGRVRVSGDTYDIFWTQRFTFKNGKIIHIRGSFAPAQGTAGEGGGSA